MRALRRSAPALVGLVLLTSCREAPAPPPPPIEADPGEVEAVVADFYARIGAADSEGLLALVTDRFEIVDGGLRMDADGFRGFLDEAFSGGAAFDFAVSRFNTVVDGAVAYTTVQAVNQTVDRTFHETVILRRIDGEWKIDRFHSTPARE